MTVTKKKKNTSIDLKEDEEKNVIDKDDSDIIDYCFI